MNQPKITPMTFEEWYAANILDIVFSTGRSEHESVKEMMRQSYMMGYNVAMVNVVDLFADRISADEMRLRTSKAFGVEGF